jgi:hypothetical protein
MNCIQIIDRKMRLAYDQTRWCITDSEKGRKMTRMRSEEHSNEILKILIVLLNGIWAGFDFVTEYPNDTAKCLQHMCQAASLAQKHNVDMVVLSGGPAHPDRPGETEAAGASAFLNFCKMQPPVRTILEDRALSTPENIIFSPMVARIEAGPNAAIGPMILSTLWGFKQIRIDGACDALGIRSRVFVEAFSNEPRADQLAKGGEEAIVRKLEMTGDWLMLGQSGENACRRRYAGTDTYDRRRENYRAAFPRVFAELQALTAKLAADGRLVDADYRGLQRVYRDDVLGATARSAAA